MWEKSVYKQNCIFNFRNLYYNFLFNKVNHANQTVFIKYLFHLFHN